MLNQPPLPHQRHLLNNPSLSRQLRKPPSRPQVNHRRYTLHQQSRQQQQRQHRHRVDPKHFKKNSPKLSASLPKTLSSIELSRSSRSISLSAETENWTPRSATSLGSTSSFLQIASRTSMPSLEPFRSSAITTAKW